MLLKQLISDLNNSIRGLGIIKEGSTIRTLSKTSFKASDFHCSFPPLTKSYKMVQLILKVPILRGIQDSLCGNSEVINSAYSFLFLCAVVITFICLTHSHYHILLYLFVKGVC